MQVQLKQSELVVAVRQFLSSQGISLANKDVDVKFSPTRGDAGVVAMIDIDDCDMPSLTPNVRSLAAVPQTPPAAAPANESVLGDTGAGTAIGDASADDKPAATGEEKKSLFS